jgi:LPXTG-motif cell wall-anchored protein
VVDTVGLAGDAGDTEEEIDYSDSYYYDAEGEMKVTFKKLEEYIAYGGVTGAYYKIVAKLPVLKNPLGDTLTDDEITSIKFYWGLVNKVNEYTLTDKSDLNKVLLVFSNGGENEITFTTKYGKTYTATVVVDYLRDLESVADLEASEEAIANLPDIEITVSGIKKSAKKAFDVTIKANRDVELEVADKDLGEGTTFKYTVSENGTYFYQAVGVDGASRSGSFKITCFEDTNGLIPLSDSTDVNLTYYGDTVEATATVDKLAQTGINGAWLYVVIFLGVAGIGFIVVRKKAGDKK